MSPVLVTGGMGFVGQRVLRALAAQGLAARVLDLAPDPARLPPGTDVVAGDIADPAATAAAAEGCRGIIHLAGLMTVDCAADPMRAVRVNVQGSVAVFEAARRAGLPVAWLSTAGVFGPADAVHPAPATVYGATKLAVEGIARAYASDHGMPSLGLRPYIVYGPGISSGIAAGPSIAIDAAVRRVPATIRFSGRVGFVHVDDVARLLVAGVIRPRPGATMLTLAGDTVEMTAFTAELARQSGWDGVSIEGPALKIPADLSNDPVPPELGPHPVTTVARGISDSLSELRALRPLAEQ
ncbi:NAD(P)-dependent oxidoreductase [Frigidibacter sp. MR17.14]|uniref:NAD-dependent epimerase/dehydratase family protein n=1 Tax=Frigidibacter sp. MR17.14 TaxID=3126509 RepID=UPI003013028F